MKCSLQTTLNVITLFFTVFLAKAQPPQTISYQGLIRSKDNTPVANSIITLRMSILKEFDEGDIVFQEEHKIRTDSFGIFSIQLGEGKNIQGAIQDINWAESLFYLRTEADIHGGSDFMEIGVTRFSAVPIALYAANAGGNLWKQDSGLIVPKGNNTGVTLLKSDDQTKNMVTVDREQDKYGRILTYTQDGSALTEISQVDSSGFIGTLGASDGTYRTVIYNDAATDAGIIGILNKTWDLVTLQSNDGLSGSIYINQELENGAQGPKMVMTSRPSAHETGIYVFNDKASYYSSVSPTPLAELKVNNKLKAGELLLKSSNGSTNVFLGSSPQNPDNGYVSVNDTSGNTAAKIEIVSEGGQISTYQKGKRITYTGAGTGKQGLLTTYGANGNVSTYLGSNTSTPNIGTIAVYNEISRPRVIQSVVSDAGYASLYGPKGNSTVLLSSTFGKPNNGSIAVFDEAKNSKAYMYVGFQGEGNVGADFMQANLFQSYTIYPKDSNKYVANTALQGPEAATYIRGTAKLVNGMIKITLPDYFTQIVSEKNITVMLTPLSDDSKGIAAINKTAGGFIAKELFAGTGNYEFDYEVKGIRKTYENEPVLVNLTGGGNTTSLRYSKDLNKIADQLESLPKVEIQKDAIEMIRTDGLNKTNYKDILERPSSWMKKKPNNINK